MAVPAGSEFSLDIQSSSGDEVSCDIIIAEHDSTSTHTTLVCSIVTLYSVDMRFDIHLELKPGMMTGVDITN